MDTQQEKTIDGSILDWSNIKFDLPEFIRVHQSDLMSQTIRVISDKGNDVITIDSGLRDILDSREIHLVITRDNIDKILEALNPKPTVRGRPYPLE